jgi:hypothetical protein
MMNRALACAAVAALAALLLLPADVSARGFAGHGFSGHHGIHHHRGVWPYGGWIAGSPDYLAAMPAQIAPAYSLAPRCTPSVETVSIPSENGGERKVTIRRCATP